MNKNIINKYFNHPSGFTLIEILVVIALVGLIGVITTQIFILGLRAQGKVEALKEVKQSGDHTLSVIESMVRNAVDIKYQCNLSTNTLTIINQDGLTTTFECMAEKISSVSGIPETTPGITPTGTPLTGGKVKVADCASIFSVVCPNPPLSPKYVFVNFTLQQNIAGVTPAPGNTVSLDYQSTVTIRNYQ